MTGYQGVLKVLEGLGVRQVFGVPGDAINPFLDAFRKQETIRFIHVAHEEAGAFAASARAKLTGELAVCAGTLGPGAVHLANGLLDAAMDHAPVLALVGQVPRTEQGGSYHQEVDLESLFADVAVYRATVAHPEALPRLLIQACRAAVGKKGVAVLALPLEMGAASIDAAHLPQIPELFPSPRPPSPEAMETAADMVNRAERVTILAGEGCRGSEKALMDLARKLQAPVVYTLRARDLVDEEDPNVAGGLGLLGSKGGVRAMASTDLLLVLGSDFPYRDWYPEPSVPVIRINEDPATLGRRTPWEVGIEGRVAPALAALDPLLEAKRSTGFLETVIEERKGWDKTMYRQEAPDREEGRIHPQYLARMVGELSDDDAVFCCDTGAVTVWGARHCRVDRDRRMIFSFNLASMAFAMPGAIGAQLAFPDRQVIALCGDGGLNMLAGDLATLVKYKLPVTVVVFNNGKLGLIQMEQEVKGYPEWETGLENPDFAALARSMGAEGMTVERPESLERTLKEALASPGPVVVDVKIAPSEPTLPPVVTLKQAFGFGMAKIRERIARGLF